MARQDGPADFFVSYTSADRAWAEWVAWELEAGGYQVVIQAWDFTPGRNWTQAMQQATSTAERVVAVLSPAYLASAHGAVEWEVFYAADPSASWGGSCQSGSPRSTRPGCSRHGCMWTWSAWTRPVPGRRCWPPPMAHGASQPANRGFLARPSIRRSSTGRRWRVRTRVPGATARREGFEPQPPDP